MYDASPDGFRDSIHPARRSGRLWLNSKSTTRLRWNVNAYRRTIIRHAGPHGDSVTECCTVSRNCSHEPSATVSSIHRFRSPRLQDVE